MTSLEERYVAELFNVLAVIAISVAVAAVRVYFLNQRDARVSRRRSAPADPAVDNLDLLVRIPSLGMRLGSRIR